MLLIKFGSDQNKTIPVLTPQIRKKNQIVNKLFFLADFFVTCSVLVVNVKNNILLQVTTKKKKHFKFYSEKEKEKKKTNPKRFKFLIFF